MKNRFFIVFIFYCMAAFSQPSSSVSKMTIKDLTFLTLPDHNARFTQFFKEGNSKRTLTPFKVIKESGLKLYLLNDFDENGSVRQSQYIISKKGIPTEFNLFLISMNSLYILYFDALYLRDGQKFNDNHSSFGITIVKLEGREFDLNSPISEDVLAINKHKPISLHYYWETIVDGKVENSEEIGEICLNNIFERLVENSNAYSAKDCIKSDNSFCMEPVSVQRTYSVLSHTDDKKELRFEWTICRELARLCNFTSVDRVVLRKVENTWKCDSVIHEFIVKEGLMEESGLKCELISATPVAGKFFVAIELKYVVSSRSGCRDTIFFHENIYQSKMIFFQDGVCGLPFTVPPVY